MYQYSLSLAYWRALKTCTVNGDVVACWQLLSPVLCCILMQCKRAIIYFNLLFYIIPAPSTEICEAFCKKFRSVSGKHYFDLLGEYPKFDSDESKRKGIV